MNEATRKGLEAILAEADLKLALLTRAKEQYGGSAGSQWPVESILRAIDYRTGDWERRRSAARELLVTHHVEFVLEIDGETHTF